ncbi:DUF4440 domain-containing protein [bacterium]|nr:DUF4440 domain-containing protein [bacterium]
MTRVLMVLAAAVSIVCCGGPGDRTPEEFRNEVRATERAFARAVADSGLQAAFTAFAADSAVLSRGGTLVKGKDAIYRFYSSDRYRSVSLQWEPEFIHVAASGDLAYTYGPYTWRGRDEEGNPVESRGVFHTVWRRQPDGSWKYVWD